jgi:hypothetical protein
MSEEKNVKKKAKDSFPYWEQVINIIAVLLGTLALPFWDSHYDKKENDLRLKQEAMMVFSTNITQTINYLETSKSYACLAQNESDRERLNDYKKKSDEYYDKFLSLNPSYEVAFTQIKIYFNKNNVPKDQQDKIISFQDMFDKHMEMLNNRNICIDEDANEKKAYEKSKNEIFEKYDDLIKDLTQQLN